ATARQLELQRIQPRPPGYRLPATAFTIPGPLPFLVVQQLETHLEHVDVVVVVLHVQDPNHEAASGTCCNRLDLAAASRTRSTRLAGLNVFFIRTVSLPPFTRARASAAKSRAVMTITGMRRHAACFCMAATT